MVTWRALQVKGTAVSNVVDQDRVVAFDVHLQARPEAPLVVTRFASPSALFEAACDAAEWRATDSTPSVSSKAVSKRDSMDIER